jgi:hypothetical protein
MVRVIPSLAAGLAAGACLLAGPALAQPASYSDVPDRFRLEAGGFRIGASTSLTFNTAGLLTTPVDFERLNVPEDATRFYIEGFWRPSRRHDLSLSWYRNRRDGDPKTVERDFTWGDRVITAGVSVTGRARSSYLSGVYRFAAYKNDRFEVGPALGIGFLWLEAGIRGQGGASAAAGEVSGPFDISKSLAQPTGALGVYLYWWPIRRLLVRADLRYILVKPGDSEAALADARAAAVYHPWRNVGFGLQYTYTKFRYDRGLLSTELGGSLRYSGGQVVLSGAF